MRQLADIIKSSQIRLALFARTKTANQCSDDKMEKKMKKTNRLNLWLRCYKAKNTCTTFLKKFLSLS